MLKLDEKKIRKGNPLGLPYRGSKKKVAKKIVEIIKQNFGVDNTIYDVFGGGGAITAECLISGLDVKYNDHCSFISSALLAVINSNTEWLKTLIISREEFYKIRAKQEKTLDDELKLLVNSFGNNRRSYLYGKSFSDTKYNLAVEILAKHDVFSGYKQTEAYRDAARSSDAQQLEHLQRLQRLRRLEVTNNDYRAFSDVKGAIIYLDPPYENTDAGGYSDSKQFSHAEFYNWAVEMARENIVLLSSYIVSDDRFEEVFRFDSARSAFAGWERKGRCEKLFMVKGGHCESTPVKIVHF